MVRASEIAETGSESTETSQEASTTPAEGRKLEPEAVEGKILEDDDETKQLCIDALLAKRSASEIPEPELSPTPATAAVASEVTVETESSDEPKRRFGGRFRRGVKPEADNTEETSHSTEGSSGIPPTEPPDTGREFFEGEEPDDEGARDQLDIESNEGHEAHEIDETSTSKDAPQKRGARLVHVIDGKFVLGRHPIPEVQQEAEQFITEAEQSPKEFHEYVDALPNRNDRYETLIKNAQDFITQEGLSTAAPPIILDAETFDTFEEETGGGTREGERGGAAFYQRAIVKEPDDIKNTPDKPRLKETIIYGNIVHELAHASGDHGGTVEYVKTDTIGQVERKTGWRRTTETTQVVETSIKAFEMPTGIVKKKYDRNTNSFEEKGVFFEEAFCNDLQYKACQQRRMTQKIMLEDDDEFAGHNGVQYVNDRAKPKITDEVVEVPVSKYVIGLPPENQIGPDVRGTKLLPSLGGFAQYGMDILSEVVPDAYDLLKKARSDAEAQREFVRKVEGVKPGLYKELRDLQESWEDFRKGVVIINKAVTEKKEAERQAKSARVQYHQRTTSKSRRNRKK